MSDQLKEGPVKRGGVKPDSGVPKPNWTPEPMKPPQAVAPPEKPSSASE
jgi:hypothetical protein